MKAIACAGFSVGRDMNSVNLLQDGNLVLGLAVTGFDSGQEPDGSWRGMIELDRVSGELEWMATADPVFWIMTTVKEPDGSRTVCTYPEAIIRFPDAGCWDVTNQVVHQRISFTCKQRVFGP